MDRVQLASNKIYEFLNKCQDHYKLSDEEMEKAIMQAKFKKLGIVYITYKNEEIYIEEEYRKVHDIKRGDSRSLEEITDAIMAYYEKCRSSTTK